MYDLAEFIKDMELITSQTQDHNLIIKKSKPALKKLLQNKNFLPIVSKEFKNNERYSRYLIYSDPNNKFFIFSMLWPPNQDAPIHDHNGTWGIEGVHQGRLRVKNFIKLPDKEKIKLKTLSQFILNSNELADLTKSLNIHKVENLDKKSISIHVYGEKLMKMNIYSRINDNDEYSMEEKTLSIDN
ncbi:MAG: cysteine dioxygenase family protein [Nanoarchaeota archaeon]